MTSAFPAARRSASAEPAREDREETKRQVLTRTTPSGTGGIADAVVIKHNDLFLLTDRKGAVPEDGDHGLGLFYRDCRYLSRYEFRLGDTEPVTLEANSGHGFAVRLALSNSEIEAKGGVIAKDTIAIEWDRVVDGDRAMLCEHLRFTNHAMTAVALPVRFAFGAEIQDVYEVRGLLDDKLHGATRTEAWRAGTLRMWCRGVDKRVRGVAIRLNPAPSHARGAEARYELELPPGGSADLDIAIVVSEAGAKRELRAPPERVDHAGTKRRLAHEAGERKARYAKVVSDSRSFNEMIHQALRDVDLLRMRLDGDEFVGAGTPWFAALFGRDSILTALELLAFDHRVAADTLELLAKHQGRVVDPWRDEQPGRILHEMRVGPLAQAGVIPHTPYYGTVDATALFLVLLAEHAAWSGSLDLFHRLRPAVDAALRWLDEFGDSDGDGFLDYHSPAGDVLINQGWKDSGDAMVRADGSIPQPPIAPIEAQAYAYRAKLAISALLKRAGETARAGQLESSAARLKERFERVFWLSDRGFYAMALEKGGAPLDVISSNPGHALWSGIVAPERAARVAARLLEEDMYTGWGIRTLSSNERRYNPLGYHLGSVWPHDTAVLVAGFKRFGLLEPARRAAAGLLDAGFELPGHRMPELLAGFQRGAYSRPVPFPIANHPQAWGAASVPFVLTTLLGLEPDGFAGRLRIVDPMLPDFVDRLELHGVAVGSALVNLKFQRRAASVEVERTGGSGGLEVEVVQTGKVATTLGNAPGSEP